MQREEHLKKTSCDSDQGLIDLSILYKVTNQQIPIISLHSPYKLLKIVYI
jgi:hypothetical protein